MKQSNNLEVLPPGKFALNANLKGGGDAAAAKQLNKLFADAQNGMRRVVALGLFAWELKEEKLDHGKFGPWLAKHCPKLATIDSVTGRAKPSRALSGYMALTTSVLESIGFPTIEKFLNTVGKCANEAHLGGGKMLLIADKRVPEELREVRSKIFELVDGKTQRSLFLEFKQAEEDADGNAKKKKGRLKGQGGATKEQRAAAAAAEEEVRLDEIDIQAGEHAAWLLENSDDNNFGKINGRPSLKKLEEAIHTAAAYLKRIGGAR